MANIHSRGLILKALFIISILSFSVRLFAGEVIINNGKTGVTIAGSSYEKLAFTTQLSSFLFHDIQTSKGSFTELTVPGYGFTNSVGDPKLPVYHKLIEIPLNASFSITYGKMQYVEYDLSAQGINNPLIPAQAPLSKNITDPGQIPFVYNSATYLKNEFLGGELVSVTPVGIMRSANLANLTVAPFFYNPVTHKLKVFTDIEVTVSFNNADIQGTIQLKKKTPSPYFGKLYGLIPNYQSNSDNLITTGPVTYVIVSDPAFHNALQPFIQWKTRKGFKVIDAYTDDPAVGNTKTSIKNYLQGLYNNPPAGYDPPSFVLLVGDVGQIPAYTVSGHPTDLNYCEYTGDHIPEVFYGRFAAANLAQLQPYIDKTLEYEQYTMPVDTFLNEVSMIAGADATNGPLYGNGQINYGTNNYFNSVHNLVSHTYLQPEPGGANYSQHIRADVSNGVAFSNYTAHGSEQGWADPSFSISQISALQNAHKYCLMVGNCCKTSNFSMTCFAKEITRVANKGALGYIGCSDYSYWDEDYWWACGFKAVSTNPQYNAQHLGAYDITFHDHGEPIDKWFVTMGQMVVGGNLAVQESSSGMKNYYWEAYCLMGDPSVSIYYSVPQPLTATYPDNLPIGTTSVTVSTEPYAYVSVSVHDSVLLDARCADSTGVVNLVFDSISEYCYMKIVVSKQNRKPLLDSILVSAFALNVQATQNILCRGDVSQLSVSINGGSGTYTYLWSPSTYLDDPAIAMPLSVPHSTILYTVTVNDGFNTVVSSPIQLTVKDTPPTPVVLVSGDTLISDADNGNQWYRYTDSIPGATDNMYVPVISGDYSTRITNSITGCFSQSNIVPFYFTGLNGLTSGNYLTIYPNPFSDKVIISYTLLHPGKVNIVLFDSFGNEIRVIEEKTDQVSGTHSLRLDGEGIASGIYIIRVETNDYCIVRRLMVTK